MGRIGQDRERSSWPKCRNLMVQPDAVLMIKVTLVVRCADGHEGKAVLWRHLVSQDVNRLPPICSDYCTYN